MPSIKQEEMDVSSSGDSSDDHDGNVNKIRLKEFQVLNTSVPPASYSQGNECICLLAR